MKKTIITICILFGVSQLFSQDKPIYSVKAGSTYSGWYGSDIDYINAVPTTVTFIPTPGIVVGGSVNFIEPIYEEHPPITHLFSGSKFEILYFENGANITSDAVDPNTGALLGFPIISNIKQSNIRLSGQSYIRLSPTFYIGGGLYTSFLLSINDNRTNVIPTGFNYIPLQLNDLAKNRFDLGPIISFKYMLTDNVSWESRVSTGVLPWNYVEEVPNVSDAYWTKAYNLSLSASFSYYFGKLRYRDSWR